MPAFNKRHRETTYAGLKIKPLAGVAGFIVCGLMAFSSIFNNNSLALGIILILFSIGGLLYAIYELIHGEDWRIRAIRFKSRAVRNTKQAMQ